MSEVATSGRPVLYESRRRTIRFLELVAQGRTLRQAARESGVKPDRALDLLQDRDVFEQQLAAIRASLEDNPDALHPAIEPTNPARQAD